MPQGATHDKMWKKYRKYAYLSSLVVFFVGEMLVWHLYLDIKYGWYLFLYPAITMIGVPVGYETSRYVTPDLDDPGITYNEGLLRRKNKLVGSIFMAYWMPYSIIPHRHFLSHGYVVSSIIRFTYQFIWIPFLHPPLFAYIFLFGIGIGMSEGDAVHIWYDLTFVERNGKLERRKK